MLVKAFSLIKQEVLKIFKYLFIDQNKSNIIKGLLSLSLFISWIFLAVSSQAFADEPVNSAKAELGVKDKAGENTDVRIHDAWGKLPLYFIKNDGQVDERAKFYEKSAGHTTFFTKEGVYLSMVKESETQSSRNRSSGLLSQSLRESKNRSNFKTEIIKLSLLNANKDPEIIAEGLQEGKVNYLIGNAPEKWKTNIPTYKAVIYKEAYPGIDIKFYGNNRQMEYDIIVKPDADATKVKFAYEGIEDLKITDGGDMQISLKQGSIIQKKPYIYQEIDGKKMEVEGRFKIQSPLSPPLSKRDTGGFAYGFDIASYDKSSPLFIDPVIVYSTYIGGSSNDAGYGIAVDTSGNTYITGETQSTDFPVVSPIQGTFSGNVDAFVTKIDTSGTSLVYSTYIGGSSEDWGFAIAVDTANNAYITGQTLSTDFPISSPIQGIFGGYIDAFITKINPSGTALVYSTYLGGSDGQDVGYGIAADTSGNAYITGVTSSTGFPTASPIYGTNTGYMDAFITKINPSGSSLVYSTYLGGSIVDPGYYGTDAGLGITVDTDGNAYITGFTETYNFPVSSPIQGSYAGNIDAFITKINPSGTALDYSTYIGGSGDDRGYGIAVDTGGNAYIAGMTLSSNFPTVSAIQGTYAGYTDAFVTKIGETTSGKVWTWGWNGSGQLGDGTTTSRYTPIQVSGLVDVIGIAGGSNYSIVLKSDGTVWAWGDNWSGKLGDGTTTQRNTPVQVSGLMGVTAIATKDTYTVTLKNDGTVWAWGYNGGGRLGDGTTTSRYTPVQVSGLTNVISIGAGNSHSMAIKNDGTVWAWGYNLYGQLGDGTTTNKYTPVQVSGLTGVTLITGGYYYTVVLKNDGTVWSWGRNESLSSF